MKKIYKNILIALLLTSLGQAAFAGFRDYNAQDIEDEKDVPKEVQYAASTSTVHTVNAIKDKNKKMYGIVGKSQVLSFNEDIARISMAENDTADVVVLSPRQVLINGKKAGSTSVIFWTKGSETPVFYNLVIQPNTDSFIQAVEHVAPNEDISIIFNETGAVLTGHISSTAVKEKITNLANAYNITLTDLTESPAKQVLLEVKVTEASKNFARELGVNVLSGKNLDMTSDRAMHIGGWGPNKESKFVPYKTHIAQVNNGAISLGWFNNNKFMIDIEASEAKGDIKILAEPKLLAVNGQEGSFTVGNQVPVPSSVGNYGNVAYSYKDTGIVLKFTPTIMEESGRIRLKLNPEISEVDDSVSVTSGMAGEVYGFKTRRVETTVELMDGETLVIAGLLQNKSSRQRNQVPVLGNIPVLGTLFSTTSDLKDNNEVIIFITPRIVDNSVKVDNL